MQSLKIKMKKGAVFLPIILMIGTVVMMIGMAGLAVSVAFNRSNASIQASNMALEAARAGIADAERRILRDPQWVEFPPPPCVSFSDPPYSLTVSNEATVDVCVNKVNNQYTVKARGSARLKKRELETTIKIDPITNQIRRQSIDEVEF